MKILLAISMILVVGSTLCHAQKWSDLSNEEKVMKAQEFRADNQNYLKTKLGMNQTQMEDIDNVNICYLSTLDRISRYGKDDASKEKYAQAITQARAAQLDVIMGPEKHQQYMEYIKDKIQKAKTNTK